MLEKFRKKIIIENIVKGLLWGLSLGFLVCAIFLMSFMLAGLNSWTYYGIAIGLGCLAWVATIVTFYFVRMPSEKVVAKRIDDTYGLQEKTSTMVAFKDQDEFLINKQREDATVHVKKQNPKKITVKLAVWTLPALILGGAVLTTSSFTNQIKAALTPTASIEDKKDDINNATDDKIKEIEDFIDTSDASQDFKEKLMGILEDLKANLKDDLDYDSRYEKVEYGKQQVDDALDEVNTKEEIGRAIVANCYQDAEKRAKNYQTGLWEVGQGMIDGTSSRIANGFNGVHAAEGEDTSNDWDGMIDEVQDTLTANSLLKILKAWCSTDGTIYKAIETAKGKNYNVPEKDSVLKVFINLNTKIKKAYENLEEKDSNASASAADKAKALTSTKDSVVQALKTALEDLLGEVNEENNNTSLAKEVKDYMDQLVDPQSNSGGNGSGDGQDGEDGDKGDEGGEGQDGQSGDSSNKGDSGDSKGEGEGDGQDGDKGDGKGNGDGGSKNDGSSESEGKGDGAGGGTGDTNTASNDKVYTGESGSTSYGDVISDYQGDAANDSKGSEDEGAIGDYFDFLYGETGGSGENGGN